MDGQQPTLQDIIRQRRETGFVGRTDELSQFRRNLLLPPGDPERRFIVCLYGEGGVGKTFLVHQLCRIAASHGVAYAYLDERADDIPAAMAALAGELARQGLPMRAFEERHRTYHRLRQELDSDPQAPRGISVAIARSALRVGLHAARRVPGVGAVAEIVDAETLMEHADRLRQFLSSKFRSDEVRLLLAPVDELSPSFVTGLRQVAETRPIALFLDSYEQTGLVLESWLLDVLDGVHGAVPGNLTLTVAGRHQLDVSSWAAYPGAVLWLPLSPFTADEARRLTAQKGVRDERVTEVIVTLSGRLPLLVAMLAEGSPARLPELVDRSGSAVERFLKWVPDERQRELARRAAVPRVINEDVLRVLLDTDDAQQSFAWLQRQSFVAVHGDGWRYHPVVRAPMLRVVRLQSWERWHTSHLVLAGRYRDWRQAYGLDPPQGWRDEAWRRLRLEETYHRLCADWKVALPDVLVDAVWAYRAGEPNARRLAETMAQAGADGAAAEVERWGDELLADAVDESDGWTRYLGRLIAAGPLDDLTRATALASRADRHSAIRNFAAALADLDRALELDPLDHRLIGSRGNVLRLIGRFEDAIAELDRAIAARPDDDWTLSIRGATHRRLGNFAQALADLDRALVLAPNDEWALAHRGDTYRRMGRYREAVRDYTRALELDPAYRWARASRGDCYRLMGRHDESLLDLDRAIADDSEDTSMRGARASTYRRTTRWARVRRTLILLERGQADAAAAEVRATEAAARARLQATPDDRDALLDLAFVQVALGDPAEAEATYRQALAVFAHPEQIREALQDLEALNVLVPTLAPKGDRLIELLRASLTLST